MTMSLIRNVVRPTGLRHLYGSTVLELFSSQSSSLTTRRLLSSRPNGSYIRHPDQVGYHAIGRTLLMGRSVVSSIPVQSSHILSQNRTFKTSARNEFALPALSMSAFGLLKSSSAIVCIVAISRLFLTILPFAAVRSVRIAAKRKYHAATFKRLQIPPAIAEFYESELAMELPIQPNCHQWKEIDTPTLQKQRRQCPLPWLPKTEHTLKTGRWPPWGGELTEEQRREVKEFRSTARKQQIFDEVYTWTYNVSRERTGLPHLPALVTGNPLKRWYMFYLPQPSPTVMTRIQELAMEDREKLYELRRWFAKEKLYAKSLQRGKWVIYGTAWLPVILFALVAVFSLEKVPFTGRWRIIMLSPEEEDVITDRLRGPGWYKTVLEMFTTAESPAPPMVQLDDWRWTWVNSVLRRLERGVEEHCRAEREGQQMNAFSAALSERGSVPPPPSYPLHPRARAASLVHSTVEGHTSGQEHLTVGPPYSLLLLDNEERNAMSYGFGEGGSGGVVVYTGILDEILAQPKFKQYAQQETEDHERLQTRHSGQPASGSFSSLLSSLGINSSSSKAAPAAQTRFSTAQPVPTEQQTLQLALVLAHELSHLILAHHLETLSWSEIVLPNATGLGSDLIRTLIYPVTFFLGPFVNDKINEYTKQKAEQTTACTDIHFSVKQEREADIVSLRLLAYAGFDSQAAVKYWADVPPPACSPSGKSAVEHLPFQFLRGGVHDERGLRFQRLLEELDRWRKYAEERGAQAGS